MAKLVVSIPFGRTTSIAIERCKNILEYVPEATIVVNFATGTDITSFTETFQDILNSKIYINTIPRVEVKNAAMNKMFVKNLLHVHITNYYYALQQNIEFTHIMFLSDMDMFVKKGCYQFINPYDAGFFVANSFVKPLSLEMQEFAPGEYVNQRHDEFWVKSVFENPDFIRIYAEQIEGQFYKKELFHKIVLYIENLSVHYSKAITNMEEGIFSNVYMNIFKSEYPIFLPISVILRDDSITEDQFRMFNIFIGENIRKNLRSHATFENYHPCVYGIKRVDFDKKQHIIVKHVMEESNKYIDFLNHNIRTKYVYVKK